MSTKKLIMIFIAILTIIILTITIFISIKFDTKEKRISRSQTAEIKQRLKNINRLDSNKINSKYSSSLYSDKFLNLSYSERDNADERIDRVLDLINNRDIQKFYDELDNYYKKARFMSYDVFKEYFDETFKEGTTYGSSGYEIDDISMRIFIIDMKTKDRVAIINTSSILLAEEKSLSMSFGYYRGVDKINYIYRNGKIVIMRKIFNKLQK